MNCDAIEHTIMSEDPVEPDHSLERSFAEPEPAPAQSLGISKPLAQNTGRPAGTQDTYKRQRKSCTTNTSMPASIPASIPESQANAALERVEPPAGLDLNTLADIMLDRMTPRASNARALRTTHWDTVMPRRQL